MLLTSIAPATVSALLTVEHLTMRFGGLVAVDDVSFQVAERQITAIIGPNGAGKTTVFNCLTGFYRPSSGRLTFRHPSGRLLLLEQLPDHQIARRAGIGRTFQSIRLFENMSVLENLMVAQHLALMRASWWSVGGLLGLPHYRRAERAAIERARAWLERVELIDKADYPANALSYGEQRKLEIVRAMCLQPTLLCLDEPAAGLNPRETADLSRFLRSLRDAEGVALLLIEHDMSVVMEISDHVIVLDYGRRIAEGTPAQVARDPVVIRAYLGQDLDDEAAGPTRQRIAEQGAASCSG
jgi:branched-chain amino acid transport system ATP-binding protein